MELNIRYINFDLLKKIILNTPIIGMLCRKVLSWKYKYNEGVIIIPKAEYKYHMTGLITNKNCDFMKEPQFVKACQKGLKQWENSKAVSDDWGGWIEYISIWAAYHARQLEGDFVECGVYRGSTVMTIMTYIDFASLKDRKFYLFDTFCGLDQTLAGQEELNHYKESYPDTYNFVVDSFKEFPNVVTVKGSVPQTLSEVAIDKVAFLSIDMNSVFPEVEALKYFWPKIVAGGIIILDDYGWGGRVHSKQKEAHDDFAASVGTKVLSLPSGQGMILKT